MKRVQGKWPLVLAITMGMSTACFSQQANTAMSDSAFIVKNVNDNKMEMQLSQLGSDKGDAPVRKIARQMLFDHGKMLTDLGDVAKIKNIKGVDIDGSSTANDYAPTGVDNTPTPSTSTATTDSATATGSGTTGANGMAGASNTSQGMAMPAMPSVTDLTNATGAEFSRMWIQHMAMMHKAKLAELQAASKTITDPDLLAAINKAIPKVQAHLDALTKANPGAAAGGTMNMQH